MRHTKVLIVGERFTRRGTKLLEFKGLVADENEVARVRQHKRRTFGRRRWRSCRRNCFPLVWGGGLLWYVSRRGLFGGLFFGRGHRHWRKNARQKCLEPGGKLCRVFSRGKFNRDKD